MGQNSKRGGRRGGHGGSGGRGKGGRGRGGYSAGGGSNEDMSFAEEFDYSYGLGFGNSKRAGSSAFSLRAEALNTERHHGWTSNSSSIRHGTINFVSAGTMDPVVSVKPAEKPKPKEAADGAATTAGTSKLYANSDGLGDGSSMEIEATTTGSSVMADSHPQSAEDEVNISKGRSKTPPFVVDIITTKTYCEVARVMNQDLIPAFSPSESRPVSRASSAASEEILFIGRNMRGKPAFGANGSSTPRAASKSREEQPTSTIHNDSHSVIVVDDPVPINSATDMNVQLPLSKSADRKKRRAEAKDRRARNAERSLQQQEEDAIREDYIANMDKEDLQDIMTSHRDLGGDSPWEDVSSDEGDPVDSSGEEDRDIADLYNDEVLQEFQLEDFDAMDTEDEMRGAVEVVLSKRRRPTGLQYLVKWAEADISEAGWISANALDSSAEKKIRVFEQRQMIIKSMAEDQSSNEEDGETDDDEYLRKKRAQEDADWKYARKLAGSEGSDLEDGYLNGEDDEEMEIDLDDFISMNINHRNGKFPDATRLANAYEGFDPRDLATPVHPAPKKVKKKAQMKQSLNISNEDLENQIQNSWQKDRLKKKARKAERAALRAEKGLGKKSSKQKARDGMDIEDLRDKITNFLLSPGMESLSLPPMNKSTRKSVHIMASASGLGSKSQGSGRKRYPTLYKTQRSSTFEGDRQRIQSTLDSSLGKLSRRGNGGGKGEGSNYKTGGKAGHTHRDGDIIGAVAPEISMDNRGRIMLEKMGYKTGMALGADGNKGIVTPIVAVFKTSKAGLG